MMLRFELLLLVCCVVLASRLCNANVLEDRLKHFHHRIQKSDVTYCEDRTKLLPSCTQCIPGLEKPKGSKDSDSCSEMMAETTKFRFHIKNITDHRYAAIADRPYGLYPYLEKPDFQSRQVIFGKMLSNGARNVLDIGAYYNPINLFLAHDACLDNIVIIEPILDALSVQVPCATDHMKKTHIMYLPITFKYYLSINGSLPRPDNVVCIGCDALLGPTRKMLETAFERPYTLLFEYPSFYRPSASFMEMNGTGLGEDMTYLRKFQPKTNETEFSKRVMKVIHYEKI